MAHSGKLGLRNIAKDKAILPIDLPTIFRQLCRHIGGSWLSILTLSLFLPTTWG